MLFHASNQGSRAVEEWYAKKHEVPDSVCEVPMGVLKSLVVYPFVIIPSYVPDLEFV